MSPWLSFGSRKFQKLEVEVFTLSLSGRPRRRRRGMANQPGLDDGAVAHLRCAAKRRRNRPLQRSARGARLRQVCTGETRSKMQRGLFRELGRFKASESHQPFSAFCIAPIRF